MVTFHLVSIFPASIDSYINESIIKRAQAKKLLTIKRYNPRDFTADKHKKVDDKPYAGGPGMVMTIQPIVAAVKRATAKNPKAKIIILSPRGKQFTNAEAKKLAGQKDIVLICGRYEGIDARVKKILKATEYSIGPYTLTGGELPALIILDAVARQIPGVLGKQESLEENRITSGEVYTRPEVFVYQGKKYRVPKVLLSGDHKKIEKWRKKRSY